MDAEAVIRQPARRMNRGSWLVLAIALVYIGCAIVYVLLAFQQPTDGWLYDTNSDRPKALTPQVDGPTPLRPGDEVLAINGTPLDSVNGLGMLPAPPGWRIGGSAHYAVRRDGQPIEFEVPLRARPASALLRFMFSAASGNFWLFGLLWYTIGFGVFFLRPRQTAARLLLLFTTYWATVSLIVYADNPALSAYYPLVLRMLRLVLNLLWALMYAMMIHFVLAFPVRKWPLAQRPRLTLSLLYGLPTLSLIVALSTMRVAYYIVFVALLLITFIITLSVATWHNLQRVRDPIARAQIGWVALGISAPIVGTLIDIALQNLFPTLPILPVGVWSVFSLFLPLCIAVAILRYRLFDIEVIIRRTLVYSLLTATLALLYAGSIVVLQRLVVPLTGSSELAIVASTLVIAALFFPLRRRIQLLIDRRFYRQKYDAQRILAAFAVTARDETNLQHLANELVRVVDTTVQPEFVGLWLREPGAA